MLNVLQRHKIWLNTNVSISSHYSDGMILEIVVKNSWSPLFQDDRCEVSEDTLEMDDLNRHECMAKLSSLLKHLVDKRISPNQPKVCLI